MVCLHLLDKLLIFQLVWTRRCCVEWALCVTLLPHMAMPHSYRQKANKNFIAFSFCCNITSF